MSRCWSKDIDTGFYTPEILDGELDIQSRLCYTSWEYPCKPLRINFSPMSSGLKLNELLTSHDLHHEPLPSVLEMFLNCGLDEMKMNFFVT